jgi:C1A family cysteine protease
MFRFLLICISIGICVVGTALTGLAQTVCSWETNSFLTPLQRAADRKDAQKAMRLEYTFTIGEIPVRNFPNGLRIPLPSILAKIATLQNREAQKHLKPHPGLPPLPPKLDWLTQGKVSSVKCQWCEDCWAFGAVAVMESGLMITHGGSPEPNLSEQDAVDCSGAGTCAAGGWWGPVLQWAQTNGIANENDYPYAHSDNPCNLQCRVSAFVSNWGFVADQGGDAPVKDLKDAIRLHGPIVVGINDTLLFEKYKSGIFNELPNDQTEVNHAIVIIGWDDSMEAWHVKNSWGSCDQCWGESGFGWISYEANHVGYCAAWVDMK